MLKLTPDTDDIAITKLGKPFAARGVRSGTQGEEMKEFIREFVRFFTAQLKP